MFAAVHVVTAGETLSQIAAAHRESLATIEAQNRQVRDPNLIYVGQKVIVMSGGWQPAHGDGDHDSDDYGTAGLPEHSASPSSVAPVYHHHHRVRSQAPATTAPANYSAGSSGSDLASVPGVPRAFAACVAFRESTNLQNPAARGNAYGIIPASGYNGYAMSLAQQKATFAHLYKLYGDRPWAPSDGCHG